MLKGSLYVTTDINVVSQMLSTNRLVIIGEPDQTLVQSTNAMVASILLPPYNCMMAKMDNDIPQFTQLYYNHLMSNEVSNFIAVMIRALYNGTNILLYSTQDEFSLYFEQFYNFMISNYGIYIGTPVNQFTVDPNYFWKLCSTMYLYELFTVEEFFVNYPQGLEIPDEIIRKLIYELNPYIENNNSFEAYKMYFYNYKERIKAANNKFLSPVMSMVIK